MKVTFLATACLLAAAVSFLSPGDVAAAPAPGVETRAQEKTGILEFIRERRARRWEKVPHRVMAFYYTWYGRPENHGRWVHWEGVDPAEHEIASSRNYPARGAYDSQDEGTIGSHIGIAKEAGIDTFVCTWWGPGSFEDKTLAKVLDAAAERDFNVSVYWETVPGEGKARIAAAVDDLVYILRGYGRHPAFLKVGGKPVIFVYGRVMGQIPLDEWPLIINRARARYGGDFLLIADGYREDFCAVFDGVHTYNICDWVQGKEAVELSAASRISFRDAVKMAKDRARIACVTVIPGYDDTKIRKPGINAERRGGVTYRTLWEEAIRTDPDWVLITSFNEWHEGSEIEPSREHGDRYVRMTGEYAYRFKSRKYSSAACPSSPPAVPPRLAAELHGLFEGVGIGVLPGFGGKGVMWLADAGMEPAELGWEDVLDRSRFNPRILPVVIYAGHEEYVRTVKEPGDVDAALVRYLREGGLMVSLATGPFPFYYDERGTAVASAATFGFPVGQGWESPPTSVKMKFEIDTRALPGLPDSVPFPDSGDPRWRPAGPGKASPGDVYLSLARLRDDSGRDLGDGIAFVEHVVSEPKGGKNLYVWMRMTDVLDIAVLLPELFRFIAGKIR